MAVMAAFLVVKVAVGVTVAASRTNVLLPDVLAVGEAIARSAGKATVNGFVAVVAVVVVVPPQAKDVMIKTVVIVSCRIRFMVSPLV